MAWFSTIYVQQATGSHNEGEDEDNCSKNAYNNYDWISCFLKVWPVDKTNREGNLKTLQRNGVTFLYAAATMS